MDIRIPKQILKGVTEKEGQL